MPFDIGGRSVGASDPVFVIAEIGLNHSGRVGRALELVDAAAWAGASAVKLQTVFSDQLVAPHCPAPAHVSAESMRDFFRRFELDFDAHRAVVQRARHHGLAVLSTPLSESAVVMLEDLALDGYKVASGDLTYDSLIATIARTRRPVVLSTGMSEMSEINHALWVAWDAGARDVALLHCVSAYPTPLDSQNLRAITTLAAIAGVPVGLSDHGTGLASAVIATALDACLYERHLMLDGDEEAIDRAVSSTPQELREIIKAVADTRAALGDGVKRCLPVESANLAASRRGLYAARPLHKGEVVTRTDIAVLRPASGLAPSELDWLIGRTLLRDVTSGAAFARADVVTAAPV